MRHIRRTPAEIFMTACLVALAVPCIGMAQTKDSKTRSGQEMGVHDEFQAMLAKVDRAQLELQNGRLDWVGAQFSKGTNTIERVAASTSGNLGYVVQIEHLRFQVPGQAKESTRTYRVTMLFRRESDGWRIISSPGRFADHQAGAAVIVPRNGPLT